jgi:hypothetical protein
LSSAIPFVVPGGFVNFKVQFCSALIVGIPQSHRRNDGPNIGQLPPQVWSYDHIWSLDQNEKAGLCW